MMDKLVLLDGNSTDNLNRRKNNQQIPSISMFFFVIELIH